MRPCRTAAGTMVRLHRLSPSAEVDAVALFEQLREEIRRGGAGPQGARATWRAQAERMWPVSAERPLATAPGPQGRDRVSRQAAPAAAAPVVRRAAGGRAARVQRRGPEARRRPLRGCRPGRRQVTSRAAERSSSSRSGCGASSGADGGCGRAARVRRSRRSRPPRPFPTTSRSRRECAARRAPFASASGRTSTTSATPRRCSTSAAAAASSCRCCARPASRPGGSTPTRTWSRTRAGEGLDVEQADAVAYARGSRRRLARRDLRRAGRRAPASGDARPAARARGAKLRPGGLLVAETINPLSPLALRSYFADLTHAQPLVPETLVLCSRSRPASARSRRGS